MSRAEARELRRYRQFYLTYPRIRESLSPELTKALQPQADIGNIRESLTPQFGVAPSDVLAKLSFSHIAELLQCDDATKRAFYELECIRGNWSVRELKRQIASLYYERSGLSKDKRKLAVLAQEGAERAEPTLVIRDPYVFEFLGLTPQEVTSEFRVYHRNSQMTGRSVVGISEADGGVALGVRGLYRQARLA